MTIMYVINVPKIKSIHFKDYGYLCKCKPYWLIALFKIFLLTFNGRSVEVNINFIFSGSSCM